MMNLTTVIVAVLVFVTISAVAGTVAEYKKRRLELELLRAAVERGQPLDPALVEHLMRRQSTDPESEADSGHKSVDFRIGGIVTIAAGIGIALLAFFLNPVAPTAFYPVMGGGVITICIGIGLLICVRAIERHRDSRATSDTGA
jgi:uncharacterized protein DUF6249